MKYYFIVASMVGGGTERVVSILANAFAKEGNEVTILLTANDTVDYELHKDICIKLLTESTNGSLKKRIERIRRIRKIYQKDPDAVFYSFGTETNLFAIVASLGKKINLILSERNDPNHCSYKILRNFIYRFGKKFVFQTKDACSCFSKAIQKRGAVIPNPIKEELPQSYEGEREPAIVTVGRLENQKNQKLLLEAFSIFHNEYPQYKLKLFGQGELLQELIQKSKELEIETYVEFMGFSKNVLSEIRKAAMFVLSSDYEGIPNSLLEAMGIGLPVICTDCPIGGPAMLIENHVNGQLVELGNKKALAKAMMKYAEDTEFAEKCGNNAVKVKELYSQYAIIEKWKEIV